MKNKTHGPTLEKLCGDPNLDPQHLIHLARTVDNVRAVEALVMNPSLPEEWLYKLAAWAPMALMKNPLWDLWMFADPGFVCKLPIKVQYALVSHPKTPQTILRRLAGSNRKKLVIRICCAENPNCPLDMMSAYRSQHRLIRAAVASNPRLPEEWHRSLSRDIYPKVREAIAERDDVDPEILRRLARDRSIVYVRPAVAGNPRTPEESLRALARSESEDIRRALAANPSTPLDILRSLSDQEPADDSVDEDPMASTFQFSLGASRSIAESVEHVRARNPVWRLHRLGLSAEEIGRMTPKQMTQALMQENIVGQPS